MRLSGCQCALCGVMTIASRDVRTLLPEHVIARVLHTAWLDLVSAIERADSPRAARLAHAAFLDATTRQCLVSPDPTWTLLAGQVRAALAIACDFAAVQRRWGRAELLALFVYPLPIPQVERTRLNVLERLPA